MKYKTGDKVKIKSFDWYIANECGGLVTCDGIIFHERMARLCGKELTIDLVYTNDEGTSLYIMKEPETQWRFTDGMIEGLADEESQEKMISLNDACEWMKNTIDDDVFINCGSVVKFMSANEFVEYFRKSMEE
jgi:hypothetical protein